MRSGAAAVAGAAGALREDFHLPAGDLARPRPSIMPCPAARPGDGMDDVDDWRVLAGMQFFVFSVLEN